MSSPAFKLLPRLWLAACIAFVVIPLAVIVAALGEFDAEIWAFLLEYQLPELLKNTLWLVAGVGAGTAVLGTTAAWLTAMYDFPLRRFFFWAMMLPLAVPAYVLAFTQIGLFDYSGPLNSWMRTHYGIVQLFPDIRNGTGLAAVMSLTFYPYVYLLARNAFSSMGQRALEAGASLGLSPAHAFFRLALPMARPWIAGGVILALMEVLADFGTVSVFGYDTFTTAVYQAWFDFYSLETAKQLAALLIALVFVLLALEQLGRGNRRFSQPGKAQQHRCRPLSDGRKWLATLYCSLILTFAFLIPLVQLGFWAYETRNDGFNTTLWLNAWHSFAAGLAAALLTAAAALLLALAKRADKSRFAAVAARIATLGYGIPGTVLAVGVFVPVAWFDNVLISYLKLPEGTTAVFKGTLAVMLAAYLIRFLAVAYAAVEAGLERISPSQAEAARSLGCTGAGVLRRIYLPLLKGSLGTAVLMAFVDIMKEMPITLMTRPYDWDTLAVRVYMFTIEGQYANAALPALLIVLTGLVPVILFSRTEQNP
ncbi:ABC transporter permease [Neisseria musculi]|uniref:Binding-protein-dependent transport system inner membrane component family protein n=1 Tax=Neisseria musculi TaxID=1815583 RepID=A0A7H1M885_9NEIS|nr:iron ABC transporter permease [Neisseria musculi]QNT57850.1 binding-protein-dependent transport system inner membrane component family protein [Neisseria musculi]